MASTVTIYHNPACSNSRNALALIRERGIEPHVVDYLKAPPGREVLAGLVAAIGLPVRELMRSKEAAYQAAGLDDPALGDDRLIDAMVEHPVLMNRPIVVTPLGARLCRPPERVLELLPPV
jgi:arsenate reductase